MIQIKLVYYEDKSLSKTEKLYHSKLETLDSYWNLSCIYFEDIYPVSVIDFLALSESGNKKTCYDCFFVRDLYSGNVS